MKEFLTKYKLIIPKVIYLVVFISILITSLCNINRLVLFKKLFNNFLFNMSSVSLIIFFLALSLVIIYNCVFIFIYFYSHEENKKLIDFDKKTDILQFIFKCLAIIFTFLMFIITPCTVVGESMSNTLHTGDRIFTVNIFYSPQRDDVIIFNAEANSSEDFYIKRVMATAGDKVQLIDNVMYVNDENIGTVYKSEFETIVEKNKLEVVNNTFVIPNGKLMVFGDNRPGSLDSRRFGLIDSSDVYGKVFLRVYPSFGGIGKDIIER